MSSQQTTLPPKFVERLASILDASAFSATLARFDNPSPPAVRFNPLQGPVQESLAELHAAGVDLQQVTWRADTFLVDSKDKTMLTHCAAFDEGRIYLQDLSSILAAHLLQARPGEEILDLAAAPGGKTLVLASDMQNTGRIAAVEAVKSRFFRLKANTKLHAASCVQLYLKDGRKVGRQCPGMFDRVLLDAPCSSEARFATTDPESFRYWSEKKVLEAQRKQKQLLYSAIQAVKPGGQVLYSTCSFAPEENEAVVDRQLQIWEDQIEVVPLEIPVTNVQQGLARWRNQSFDSQLENAVRILPNDRMHGFFICLLHKRA